MQHFSSEKFDFEPRAGSFQQLLEVLKPTKLVTVSKQSAIPPTYKQIFLRLRFWVVMRPAATSLTTKGGIASNQISLALSEVLHIGQIMKKKRLQKVSDNKDLSEIKTTLVLFYSEVFITRIWRLQRACKSNVLTSVTTFYHFLGQWYLNAEDIALVYPVLTVFCQYTRAHSSI